MLSYHQYLHKQNISNKQVNLSYSKYGTSVDNFVICIHGITRNSSDFNYLATELAKHYTVICVDIFGRGESSWLEDKRNYNYSIYYHSIINLIKSLKIKNLSLMGTSMGGIISMYIAAYNPELIKLVILNDIGPYIDLSALQKLAVYIKKFPKFLSISDAEDYLKMFLSPLRLEKAEHFSHMIKNTITIRKDGNYYLNYDPAIGEKFDEDIKNMKNGMNLWHLWKKITQPVLVLRGEKSDLLTRGTVKQMVNSGKDIEFIEYKNIGHTPSLMEDNQILDIVKWLNIKS